MFSSTNVAELTAAHSVITARLGVDHWLSLHAASILGAELLTDGELDIAATLLNGFYSAMARHGFLIFYVWPAARAAYKLGSVRGAPIRAMVLAEAERLQMSVLHKELCELVKEAS